jgi:hydrogenase expression/formation protein HypE
MSATLLSNAVSRGLPSGKLPVSLLRGVLRYRGARDPAVVVGPGLGRDAAVVDLGNQYLVLKSDPVTFTAQEVGWYAVHVNANDVAVMGARPRWFQPTIILPEGCPPATALAIARDIHRAAVGLGVAVTGGHSEVSPAVRRPIVAGDMQGLVARRDLKGSTGARPGDLVVMTKTAGIEGTSILAREHPGTARAVLGAAAAARAARFHRRPGISVVPEATVATACRATAMHDPTEGGVAAALFELAAAAEVRLVVDLDEIPVHAYTRQLCKHYGLRWLGLIGSGALLATVQPRHATSLFAALHARRIPVRVIGQVKRGRGVTARQSGRRVPFIWSERDELARVFS